MNLNQPVFDSVLAIDEQLQKLQSEVTQMETQFHDYRPPGQAKSLSPQEISEEVPAPRKVTFAPKQQEK